MPAERLQAFSGELPRLDQRLLPANAAQRAMNVILTSGRIEPVYTPLDVDTISIAMPRTIYRMYDDNTDYWLAWEQDVNVARAIIADDASFRIIISGDGMSPSTTDLLTATSSPPYPRAWYVLGVTPPVTAPTVVVVGGVAPTEVRTYVYTFVTQWGEESMPSPASTPVTGFVDGSWNLSNLDTTPPNSYPITNAAWAGSILTLTVDTTFGLRAGEYLTLAGLLPNELNASYKVSRVDDDGVTVELPLFFDPGPITDPTGTAARESPHNTVGMVKRIYRSLTVVGVGTEFFFVDEIPISQPTYADTVPANELGETLVSEDWEMPPAEMKGVVMHPSGSAVGFLRNTMYFSEPGAPYAFPAEYQQSTDSAIVGIGVIGQSIVVGTEGRPYICSGTDPAAMSMVKREQPWPCLAKRGMVPTSSGILYPTPLGLALIGGQELIWTKQVYSQVEWEVEGPEGFTSAQYDDRYFATAADGNLLVVSGDWGVSRIELRPSALYTDQANGKLYLAYDAKIWEWNASGGARLTAEWISKEFVVPQPISLGAAKIDAENVLTQEEIDAINNANAAIIAANQAILAVNGTLGWLHAVMLNEMMLNGDPLTPVNSAVAKPIQFTLYVDGALFYSRLVTDTKVFRLPGRAEYDNFAVGVASQTPIKQVVIGDSPAALKTA